MPALLILLALCVLGAFAYRGIRSRRRRARPRGPRVTERLTDPREAAAILLVQQAVYEGHVTTAHKQAILSEMRDHFGVTPAEAEGLFSFARMAVGQTGDAVGSLRRLLAPVRDRCTLSEMKDLAAMLERIGAQSGPPNDAQTHLVFELRRALSLPEPDQTNR